PVAGHIARPEVDSVFIGQIQYHARTRFPAAAFYMWFIRTVGDIVYIGPESGQFIFHTIIDILHILLGHTTQSDSTLVGHYEYFISKVIQFFNTFADTL